MKALHIAATSVLGRVQARLSAALVFAAFMALFNGPAVATDIQEWGAQPQPDFPLPANGLGIVNDCDPTIDPRCTGGGNGGPLGCPDCAPTQLELYRLLLDNQPTKAPDIQKLPSGN